MKSIIITICLIASGLLILQDNGIFDCLFYLITAGILPGSNHLVSANTMLICITVLAVGIIVVPITLATIHFIRVDRLARQYVKTTHRLPKRRYQQA